MPAWWSLLSTLTVIAHTYLTRGLARQPTGHILNVTFVRARAPRAD